MNFLDFLNHNLVYLDGGMGTLLQKRGLQPGELPERWNLTHPEEIRSIHQAYFDAGSHVVNTNTFGANRLHFSGEELEDIICHAVANAKAAREASTAPQEKFIALDIGPSGKLLKPYGDFDFEEAVALFAEPIKLGAQYGVDLIVIETMNDSYETKAALLAAKENSNLPVLVSNAYGEDGKLMTGASPEAMAALLEGMGANAIGANCSLGPAQLVDVIERLLAVSSVPVLLKPNAGLPKQQNGTTQYDVSPEEFAQVLSQLTAKGVRVVGGCCGTTPEYIKALVTQTRDTLPVPCTKKHRSVVSSYTHAVSFGKGPVLIGERINPTGKKRFQQALRDHDIDYVLNEGIRQQEAGVHVLDVNVGLPDLDEVELLPTTVCALQAILDLPLQIDTANPTAMEAALRRCNGKPLINSVTGKLESMHTIFPLVRKYGGMVVALTLDEDGIPDTAEGRVTIAKKILSAAAQYGIEPENLIFDPLAMTISADRGAANVTLEALRRIRTELGCHTSLGVSNVSFGLPNRDAVNSTFFALALEHGLSAAIMNPHSADMMKTYYTYRALRGLDENCADYIKAAGRFPSVSSAGVPNATQPVAAEARSALQTAILQGRNEQASSLTKQLLQDTDPLELVQREIIPALDVVGKGFEAKTVYLPQLLMSAEAAKCAFEVIKTALSVGHRSTHSGIVILATVQGDIHDIGKNIVKLLLENYGFSVLDLGKDVPPEIIVQQTVARHAPLVGLSALMTTTVPAMEETIRQLKLKAPWCKTVVGGAVLNPEYASNIGADQYAKDAMDTVRYAEQVINQPQ